MTQSVTIDPASNGGARAEISVKGANGKMDIEVRYCMERGVSGHRRSRIWTPWPPRQEIPPCLQATSGLSGYGLVSGRDVMLVPATSQERPVEKKGDDQTEPCLRGTQEKNEAIIPIHHVQDESGQGANQDICEANDYTRCRGKLGELQAWKHAL